MGGDWIVRVGDLMTFKEISQKLQNIKQEDLDKLSKEQLAELYMNLNRLKQLEEEDEFFQSVVGKGYDDFIETKERYRVLKGGRGSKKSATTALDYMWKLKRNPLANLVCVRKTGITHKDSTFAQLKWAATKLNVYDDWEFKVSPLEAVCN